VDTPRTFFITQEQNAYDLGKCYYFLIKNSEGYGYTIVESTKEGKRRTVFNHHDKNVTDEMHEQLKKDGKCGIVIFNTSFVYQYILILTEEHGSRYYYVPNLPCLYKTCRSIVMERIEDGFWYPTEESIESIEPPTLSQHFIEKMKDGPTRRAAQQEWLDYKNLKEDRDSEITEFYSLKFIEGNDTLLGGEESYKFLKERSRGEYEGIQIQDMGYIH